MSGRATKSWSISESGDDEISAITLRRIGPVFSHLAPFPSKAHSRGVSLGNLMMLRGNEGPKGDASAHRRSRLLPLTHRLAQLSASFYVHETSRSLRRSAMNLDRLSADDMILSRICVLVGSLPRGGPSHLGLNIPTL